MIHYRTMRRALLAATLIAAWLAWSLMDARSASLLQNTGMLAMAVILLSVPLATFLAFLLARFHVPGLLFWETCMLVLIFMPSGLLGKPEVEKV